MILWRRAALSLTVIRMVPVAVALVGWFGSRGLASEVFALVALEEPGTPLADHAVAVITITVLLSVVVHGAMADPLATRSCRAFARERRQQRCFRPAPPWWVSSCR